jgi:GT2 family glycosyltransferase
MKSEENLTKISISDESYARWVAEYDTFGETDWEVIRQHVRVLTYRPDISIVMMLDGTSVQFFKDSIESVLAQLYGNWELCIAIEKGVALSAVTTAQEYAAKDTRIKPVLGRAGESKVIVANSAIDLASGEFVMLLGPADLLPRHALYEMAVELERHPDTDLLYADEDRIDTAGHRFDPQFKPAWSEELMLGCNLIGRSSVYRRQLVERVGRLRPEFDDNLDYDLALRMCAAAPPDRIRHLPAIIYHARFVPADTRDRSPETARRAISDYLQRREIFGASIEPLPTNPEWNRVVFPISEPEPLVSVIVPTRDRSELLARCADGVLNRTNYSRIEFIVVDNDSQDLATKFLFEQLLLDVRVKIINFPGEFNYSAMNNTAARQAQGDVLLLLNNDIDVIGADWLRELVSHAIRPEVAVVGAKLLYPSGQVQHGGMVVGANEELVHVLRLADRNAPGYQGQLVLTRALSMVTGACLAIRRKVYLEIGGFDEENLRVAFNDVDMCLRAADHGYRVIWTPHAELFHFESASRGAYDTPEKVAVLRQERIHMERTWGALLEADPFHNPNLLYRWHGAVFPSEPRRRKPWKS